MTLCEGDQKGEESQAGVNILQLVLSDDVFFFQAEDGIRAHCVTGVQTCALPICYF